MVKSVQIFIENLEVTRICIKLFLSFLSNLKFLLFILDLEPVITYAVQLDVEGKKLDDKTKKQYFLEIQNVESYYNFRTVQESFQIMTSYLALDEEILFPLSNVKTSFQNSRFNASKDKMVISDSVSLRTIDNKRKFLTFNIIEDNRQSAEKLKTLVNEYLINQPRFCNGRKFFN